MKNYLGEDCDLITQEEIKSDKIPGFSLALYDLKANHGRSGSKEKIFYGTWLYFEEVPIFHALVEGESMEEVYKNFELSKWHYTNKIGNEEHETFYFYKSLALCAKITSALRKKMERSNENVSTRRRWFLVGRWINIRSAVEDHESKLMRCMKWFYKK